MRRPKPLRTDRLRTQERPFSWIPFRILSGGYLKQMSPTAKLLYFFLCLVADRKGLSFYGDRRLSELLGISGSAIERARTELCRLDFLAFDGRIYQVLSLPSARPEKAPRNRTVRNEGPVPLGRILRQLQQDR